MRLTVNDAVKFNRYFEYELTKSYNWDLADAAEFIIGDVSDDPNGETRLLNLRIALMSMGSEIDNVILDSPDIIADLEWPKEYWLDEKYWRAVVSTIVLVTGGYQPLTALKPDARRGESWGERVKERFPILIDLCS